VTHILGLHLAEAVAATSDVVILPIGVWQTDKYGKVDLSEAVADEIITNFHDNVLGRQVRVDIDHGFAEAAGWIADLGYGTFADPKTGESRRAVVARVDWTPVGEKALSDKEYRYSSAAYGKYTDPASGKLYDNVLRAFSLTNDPVLQVPAVDEAPDSVEFAGVALSESLTFGDVDLADGTQLGDVVEDMRARHAEREAEQSAPDKQAAQWGSWEATSSFEKLVREAVASGLEGDALKARIDVLAADLPAAVMEAISNAVDDANSGEDTTIVPSARVPQTDPTALSDTGAEDPVSELLSRFDGLMDECDAIVKGTAGVKSMRTLASETRKKLEALLTKKGGTTTMSDTETKLAEERDDALTKLAAAERRERERKVDAALQKLSDKGMSEPARKQLRAILTAEDTTQILLSEAPDAKPVDVAEALLGFAESVEFVPIEKPKPEGSQDNKSTVTLSDAEIKAGKDMGVSEEYMLKAKAEKLAAEAVTETAEEE